MSSDRGRHGRDPGAPSTGSLSIDFDTNLLTSATQPPSTLAISRHFFQITLVGGDQPLEILGVNDGFFIGVRNIVVPEPATLILALLGISSVVAVRWKRWRRSAR